MHLKAIEQAGERLQWAEDALERYKAATDYNKAEKAWSEFLLAASAFYSKLEQGSKANGKSTAWFGRKVKQRKDDPVLKYVHQARNSDEHGIERVTERNNAGWDIPFGQQKKTTISRVDHQTGENTGDPIDAFLYGERLVAVTAHDRRYNDSCDPPIGLIGTRDGANPADIADVAMESLKDILEEAAALV